METNGTRAISPKTEAKNSKWLHIDVSDPVPQNMTDRFKGVVLDCGYCVGDCGEIAGVPGKSGCPLPGNRKRKSSHGWDP